MQFMHHFKVPFRTFIGKNNRTAKVVIFFILCVIFLAQGQAALAVLAIPSSLAVSNVGKQSATLSWSLDAAWLPCLANWTVRYSSDGLNPSFETTNTPTTSFSYAFTGLSAATQYYFSVGATFAALAAGCEQTGDSSYATSSVVTTQGNAGYSPPLVSVEETKTTPVVVVEPLVKIPVQSIPSGGMPALLLVTVTPTPVVDLPTVEEKPVTTTLPAMTTSENPVSKNSLHPNIPIKVNRTVAIRGGKRFFYQYSYKNTSNKAETVSIMREVLDESGKVIFKASASSIVGAGRTSTRQKYQTFYDRLPMKNYTIRITARNNNDVTGVSTFALIR